MEFFYGGFVGKFFVNFLVECVRIFCLLLDGGLLIIDVGCCWLYLLIGFVIVGCWLGLGCVVIFCRVILVFVGLLFWYVRVVYCLVLFWYVWYVRFCLFYGSVDVMCCDV